MNQPETRQPTDLRNLVPALRVGIRLLLAADREVRALKTCSGQAGEVQTGCFDCSGPRLRLICFSDKPKKN